jgi:hypothetical protein
LKKRTVFQKIFCVFKPRKNDILTEAESIIDNYIYKYEETYHPNDKSSLGVINMVMNAAIIVLSVVLSYMLYLVLK